MEVKNSRRLFILFHGCLQVEHELKPVALFSFLDDELFISCLIVDDLYSGIRKIIHTVDHAFNVCFFAVKVISKIYLDRWYLTASSEACFKFPFKDLSSSHLLYKGLCHVETGVHYPVSFVLFFVSLSENSFVVTSCLVIHEVFDQFSEFLIRYGHPGRSRISDWQTFDAQSCS